MAINIISKVKRNIGAVQIEARLLIQRANFSAFIVVDNLWQYDEPIFGEGNRDKITRAGTERSLSWRQPLGLSQIGIMFRIGSSSWKCETDTMKADWHSAVESCTLCELTHWHGKNTITDSQALTVQIESKVKNVPHPSQPHPWHAEKLTHAGSEPHACRLPHLEGL